MKRLIYILPLLSLMVISCNREPLADATVDLNPAYVGEMVRFTSYSTNAESVEWDMDDGFIYNTSVVDHYFVDPGYYDVRLSAYGVKGDISTAVIPMEVIGSAITITVEDIDNEGTYIPETEIYLFRSLADWDTGNLDLAFGPFYTNSFGVVTIDGLSYQKYYVDAYISYGNTGYVNWLLGEEDEYWIETQLLSAGPSIDHYFTAYVEYVSFDKKKAAAVEEERKGRIPASRAAGQLKAAGQDRPFKENKSTAEGEKR
ncbi:MAG: PKD domain-containing protein [Bacteroidales bacterium]|nr:PKD domain-containing protein [Bacteroidales bacterium]